MLRIWWANHRAIGLPLAIALMALLALLKLGDEFRRLVWWSGPSGAIDLRLLHELVHRWFAGEPVYSQLRTANHPPASYVMLWPLLGWLAVTPARWFWAVTTVAALWWLVRLVVRESGAESSLERLFVALLPLSMNATGVTIGNGQLTVHIIPALVAGLLLLQRGRSGWPKDLLAAALLLASLAKPSIAVPFFWIVLFVPGRLRPALLVTVAYITLTLFAASFQESSFLALLQGWMTRSSALAVSGGYANLHIWLAALGQDGWILPASLLILGAVGIWTFRHRHDDPWLLTSVAALAARFWTYHRVYDDVLILLPMIALFRIARRGYTESEGAVAARALLAITVLVMLLPARLLVFPPPWGSVFRGAHAVIWIVVLIFLLGQARRKTDPVEVSVAGPQSDGDG